MKYRFLLAGSLLVVSAAWAQSDSRAPYYPPSGFDLSAIDKTTNTSIALPGLASLFIPARHDGPLDDLLAALVNVCHREVALHRRHRGDGFRHAAMVVPTAAEQAGLVEVDVRIDEAGQSEPAADVDLGCLAGEARFDGGDAPTGDADIDRRR